jgi:23S rRNA (pseudouridine1915-N3)-methyltransferase
MEPAMLVRVLAVGTKMPDWVVSGVTEYQRRLSSDIRLEFEEIPLPKRRGDTQALVAAEAEAIQKRLQKYPAIHTVALEVLGRQISTPQLAQKMQTLRDQSQDMALLIGGPDGLDPQLSKQCHEQWSLSALTLPHPLVRILVAEQIYRGWSLLSGHPYHR